MSDSVRPHRRQPTRLPLPWDSPGKNTGVGCHFLLQCMRVKSEGEVAQSYPTLSDPMDCSLPGSSIQGIFQARGLEEGAICSIKSYHKMMAIITAPSSISLCLIYFTHSSLCLLIPYPILPLPSSLSLLVTTSLFSITVNLFLFLYLHLFLDPTYK